MSEEQTEYQIQGFDEKELKRQFWLDYQFSHTISTSSINDGQVEIENVGSFEKFNFLVIGLRREAILFNGIFGKVKESQVLCKSSDCKQGKLLVEPTEIPSGFKISPDRDCKNCVMGTIQRYKMEGYSDKLPACSAYTFVEGYALDKQERVHVITLRLTGIGSKPFDRVQRSMKPGDEMVVSVEGDFSDRTAKFNFAISKEKRLEPHTNLPALFKENIASEFEAFLYELKELQIFRESISPYSDGGFLGLDNPNNKVPAIGYEEPEF